MTAIRSPLSASELSLIDRYFRAANYLSVGQIYLLENPLLRTPLSADHVKRRLLGHWGTTPGLNFIYTHLNRAIRRRDLNLILITGPGHGGPAIVANAYLEGTYSELYPEVSQDEAGMRRLFKQFSFPGGIPSHVAPEVPGSIHEGGELGYSLSHAYGAVFDNPGLIAACVVGDGEAETGPLATAWHSNKFLNPQTDGAVLPILHVNGYKIAGPTVFARLPRHEVEAFFEGCGYSVHWVEGADPLQMHQQMAHALESALKGIAEIRRHPTPIRPRWPMIVLKTPKGWGGPKVVDGVQVEGSFRAHQVPLNEIRTNPDHLRLLEEWLRSYQPEELFDEHGRLRSELQGLSPLGTRRIGANSHANGGLLLQELALPDHREYAVSLTKRGAPERESTRVQGSYIRDVMKANLAAKNFLVFSPDETASNRWQDLFQITTRRSLAEIVPSDDHISAEGRVFEVLSEHQCQGWLEGYLLTGRHGFFSCYEAFIHIVDSMFNQHAKWLKVARTIPWRKPIASLNYLLSSHVWRQDHNGFSHQDPGFIDHVVNKRAEVIRVYLPPDANTLLCVTERCLRSKNLINVIVAGKHPAPQWLSMEEAAAHTAAGIGIWEWASHDNGVQPDVVLGCCGDVPTLEALAAVKLIRHHLPELRVRVVNVVDLMRLQPPSEHPHGLPDEAFDRMFTKDKPIIFAYHGYPWLIHRLTYRRTNHGNLHVRGYKEEGTTTTPFDMTVLNDLDRFHLLEDVAVRVEKASAKRDEILRFVAEKLAEHRAHITTVGEDLPEIQEWQWEE